jgi:hypothetical protein
MILFTFGYTFAEIRAMTPQQLGFLLGGLRWYHDRLARR